MLLRIGKKARNDVEFYALMKKDLPSCSSLAIGKVIDYKWVYTSKKEADEAIHNFESLLFGIVFKQIHGLDCEDMFNPVVIVDTIRSLAPSLAIQPIVHSITRCFEHIFCMVLWRRMFI